MALSLVSKGYSLPRVVERDDYTRTAKARVDQPAGLGLSDPGIGELLGLSKQRIQQIRTSRSEDRQSA